MESSPVNYLKFTVSQIYSPTHFYVLPEDDVAILQDLTEVLREKYENSNPVPVLHPDVGSFWVTRSEIQECWARVKVIKVKECEPGKSGDFCENTCHVFLVDLGVFETVRVSTLRPLVREVLDISCIALRCRMVGIYPYSCSPVCLALISQLIIYKYIYDTIIFSSMRKIGQRKLQRNSRS